MDDILLVGAGGHARSCIDVIEESAKFNIIGLVDYDEKKSLNGYPVIGNDEDLPILREKCSIAFITVGQIKTALKRKKLFDRLLELNFIIPKIISPRAHLSKTSSIGQGSIVMHDVIINANVKVGKNCILNSKSLIEHDTKIKDHCHISTGAIINGNVYVNSGSFIGSGSVIKNDVTIGKECIIGMGANIKSNILDKSLVKVEE